MILPLTLNIAGNVFFSNGFLQKEKKDEPKQLHPEE